MNDCLLHCRTVSSGAGHKIGWGAHCNSRKLWWGCWGTNLKKKLVGGMGGGLATGIYLTKHSCQACVWLCVLVCVCVHACLERGRKRERIMVTQAVWLIQTEENTTRLWLVQHTHTPACTHTHSHTNPRFLSSFSSRLSTRASIQRGQPKRGESSPDNSPSYPNRIQSVHKGL